MKRFINAHIPFNACNLRCSYCYITQLGMWQDERCVWKYAPKEMAAGLTKRRLGGVCCFNFCAAGETLLCPGIHEVILELLCQGHIVNIVTNGTPDEKIKQVLAFPQEFLERIFFKLSFHYEQLRRIGALNRYVKTVKMIKFSPCSFTVELIADGVDERLIREIEEFSERKLGAKAHVLIPRNDMCGSVGMMTYGESEKNFLDRWSRFDSSIFNFKRKVWGEDRFGQYCYAGDWTVDLNMATGRLTQCYGNGLLSEDIFRDPTEPIQFRAIGRKCPYLQCYNAHALLSLGAIPSHGEYPTYGALRDRVEADGTHWLKPFYQSAFSRKLSNDNFRRYDREWMSALALERRRLEMKVLDWHWNRRRKSDRPRIYLLGVPEHANIGDAAIVKAMNQFLMTRYPQYEIFPFTTAQTMSQTSRFQMEIRPWDVICLPGGGNFGNQYKPEEELFKTVISSFPNNPIFIFPQTIYFTPDSSGAASFCELAKLCRRHRKLSLFVREWASYERYAKPLGIGDRLSVAPDMAFCLDVYREEVRKGAYLCMRNDCEGVFKNETNDFLKASIYRAFGDMPIRVGDMIAKELITYLNRDAIIDAKLREFSQSQVVITDRLHGMIFAYLTGTPCLALSNYNHKNSSVFEGFVSDVPYMRFARTREEWGPKLMELAELSGCVWRPEKSFSYGPIEGRLKGVME